MKRFIDLRGNEIPYNFAWWCTIVDRFETVGGEMAWSTIEEFKESWESDEELKENFLEGIVDINRYLGLIPGWVPEKEET